MFEITYDLNLPHLLIQETNRLDQCFGLAQTGA